MDCHSYSLRARDKCLQLGFPTRLMGIVNVTPDSFSDGGRFLDPDLATQHALDLARDGADIIDIGAESSRPGAEPLPADVELDRILPVLDRLRPLTDALISIDTYKADVAERCLTHGADIINDISAFRLDTRMPEVVATFNAGVVLMHMRGTPQTMQELPQSPNILRDIQGDLARSVEIAARAGINRNAILLDPGIGFGKTVEDNLLILNRLSVLAELGFPLVVGPSRKSFIGRVTGAGIEGRLVGTIAACLAAYERGAHVVRVHDVRETREALAVAHAIRTEKLKP